ncbi:hypothetical protein BJ508DRAFT_367955 [Ascobolus immersus RN42]|uniref:Uncharacterized protein n=1 Tax=Ascobolus immersus RN42 TaxID=1160509 RepID=A0A3N4HAW5_ASCIM|nr:hypothetical protein BJ508DRAFT_367955 [Ascobolus immersus RN42]
MQAQWETADYEPGPSLVFQHSAFSIQPVSQSAPKGRRHGRLQGPVSATNPAPKDRFKDGFKDGFKARLLLRIQPGRRGSRTASWTDSRPDFGCNPAPKDRSKDGLAQSFLPLDIARSSRIFDAILSPVSASKPAQVWLLHHQFPPRNQLEFSRYYHSVKCPVSAAKEEPNNAYTAQFPVANGEPNYAYTARFTAAKTEALRRPRSA